MQVWFVLLNHAVITRLWQGCKHWGGSSTLRGTCWLIMVADRQRVGNSCLIGASCRHQTPAAQEWLCARFFQFHLKAAIVAGRT